MELKPSTFNYFFVPNDYPIVLLLFVFVCLFFSCSGMWYMVYASRYHHQWLIVNRFWTSDTFLFYCERYEELLRICTSKVTQSIIIFLFLIYNIITDRILKTILKLCCYGYDNYVLCTNVLLRLHWCAVDPSSFWPLSLSAFRWLQMLNSEIISYSFRSDLFVYLYFFRNPFSLCILFIHILYNWSCSNWHLPSTSFSVNTI